MEDAKQPLPADTNSEPTIPDGGAPSPAGGITSAVLDRDVSCVKCSYNLRGLPSDRNCPECGEPIASSIKGFMLQDASAEYRATMRSGLSLVLNGLLAMLIFMLGSVAAPFIFRGGYSWFQPLVNGVGFVIGCVMLLGYWRYTEPDPGYVMLEQPSSARNVVRASVAIGAGLALLRFMLGFFVVGFEGLGGNMGGAASDPGATAIRWLLGLVSLAVSVVQFVSVMSYTAWVGDRVPDHFVFRRAKMYRWLLPVIYVLGVFAIGLGPLIALIMYWNLLDRVRKHLRSIEATGIPAELPNRMG